MVQFFSIKRISRTIGIRKDLMEKPVEFRRGHATVSGSKSNYATGRKVWEGWMNYELEPGELPVVNYRCTCE